MESIMSVIPAVLACPSPSCPTLNARKSIKEDLYWPTAQNRICIGQQLRTGFVLAKTFLPAIDTG